ncbi:MAG: thioredoxin fold domain-containing protein [Woeseiaceae bacterium]
MALAACLLAPSVDRAYANGDVRENRDPRAHFFTQTFGDLPEEMQAARDEGKLGMLLFFEAEACSYCQHMLRRVFNQPGVQDWYNERFVNIAIDIHGDVEITDFDGITLPSKVFSDHRRIFLTPVMSFIGLDGTEMYRHLGMIRTPAEFLLLGEYIEGHHYYDTEYRVFAKSRGMSDEDGISTTPAKETE